MRREFFDHTDINKLISPILRGANARLHSKKSFLSAIKSILTVIDAPPPDSSAGDRCPRWSPNCPEKPDLFRRSRQPRRRAVLPPPTGSCSCRRRGREDGPTPGPPRPSFHRWVVRACAGLSSSLQLCLTGVDLKQDHPRQDGAGADHGPPTPLSRLRRTRSYFSWHVGC